MNNKRYILLILITAQLLLMSTVGEAQAPPRESAVSSVPRTVEFPWMSLATWQERHQADVIIANEGGVELLFLGDSITESWDSGDNAKLFDQYFGDYVTANFGIGGDQTQHQIWRLQNGSTGNLDPKVTFLMIGVNNFGHSAHSAQEVFDGIVKVIEQTKTSFPDTKIMLHAILPFGAAPDTTDREKVIMSNQLLTTLANNEDIFYYNFGELFLDADGNIPRELMPDSLHPSYRGLELWGEKLAPVIKAMMTNP